MQFCTNAFGTSEGIWTCAIQFGDAFLGGPILDMRNCAQCVFGTHAFFGTDMCNSAPRRVRVRGHAIVEFVESIRVVSVSDVESILEHANSEDFGNFHRLPCLTITS